MIAIISVNHAGNVGIVGTAIEEMGAEVISVFPKPNTERAYQMVFRAPEDVIDDAVEKSLDVMGITLANVHRELNS